MSDKKVVFLKSENTRFFIEPHKTPDSCLEM